MKHITLTVIFEGSALNRDEKIGGNILSIKKLKRGDRTVSFIGKPAIRHYLFETLVKASEKSSDMERWKDGIATVVEKGSGDKKTLQFDLSKWDILNSPELDVFGYMYTQEKDEEGKGIPLNRKSPIGITKAVGLDPYEGDMALYSTHDLGRRYINTGQGDKLSPSIYNKEEHISFYKVSFTIDVEVLGKDEWILTEEPKYNGEITLKLPDGNEKKISNAEKKSEREYNVKDKEGKTLGSVKWEKISGTSKYKVTFELDSNRKKQRIYDILNAIKNGFYAQSSNEANTIVPLFIIASPVKVPSPIFHPYIDIIKSENGYTVVGISDCLKNSWIDGKVFIMNSERLKVDSGRFVDKDKITHEWDSFLNEYLKCEE